MRQKTKTITTLVTFLATVALGVLPGCDNKIGQCNHLIKVINEEGKNIKGMSGDDTASLNTASTTLENTSKKVAAVELKDPKLIAFRDTYKKMAEDLAAAAKDTAAAIDSKDAKRIREAHDKMNAFPKRENDLVSDINKYCRE